MKAQDIERALSTWHALQEYITGLDEKGCLQLLEAEKKGQCRLRMLLRIHSRLNRVRAHRERNELEKIARS